MLNTLSLLVVVLAGLYFVVLSAVILAAPARASSFLAGFASSATTHYVELLVRWLVGAAFLIQAARVPLPAAFSAFGWLLLVTTAGLFLVPWRWHRRFALRVVPHVLRYCSLVALVSLLIGGFVLWSAIHGAGWSALR